MPSTLVLSAIAVLLAGSAQGAGRATGTPPATTAAAVTVYISPQGRDAWSGRLAAPNRARTDGPLATLGRAVEDSRKLRTAPGGASGRQVRIVLRAGTYDLARPVELGPEDSGLVIEAAPGERAVVSGGRPVTLWRPYRGAILQADLSHVDLPDLNFLQLYYGGHRQPLARVPNFDPRNPRQGGYLTNAAIVEAGTKTKFRYRPGELDPAKWKHPERAIVVFHDSLNYQTTWAALKSVDPAARVIEAAKGIYPLAVGSPYYICNVFEELDSPGEWYVDPDSKTLYFWPPATAGKGEGARPAGQVVVPALDSVFVLKGDVAPEAGAGAKPPAGRSVGGVRIAHLSIRDCRGKAVHMTGARGCAVVGCDVRNVGTGVYVGDDTHDCRVVGCDITQTLVDGVDVWGSSLDHNRDSGHLIDNNHIWDFGWGAIHNRCAGVFLVRCSHCRVTHNTIHDGPRYAIGMDVGDDCEIAYNLCHDVNLETCDTGIIEAATAWDWGRPDEAERNRLYNRGNSIHDNLLYDSGGWGTGPDGKLEYPHFSWGIYLDTHCSGWRVYNNVVYNTVLGGFMNNCGLDNIVENNIFADGKTGQVQWNPWPKYPFHGNRCERNIISYQGRAAVLYTLNGFKDAYCHFADNLVWARGETPRVAGLTGVRAGNSWAAWLKRGQDKGTIVADPQFVDAAHHDYHLKPTSPALKLGFKPVDVSHAGVYASPDRCTWPVREPKMVRPRADYTPPKTLSAHQIGLRTYEDYAVGETERYAAVGQEGAGTVAVTDETAASGRHSLKFTDAAGLQHDFVPYVTYPLEMDSGTMRAGFDLRVEKGARFVYEWRDDPYVYNLGPQLSVGAEGWLAAAGKRLLQVPVGKWVRFDVTCGLGPQATGTYDLTVKLPGAEAKTFRGLACSPKFKYLNCVVIMSMATAPTVFYVDNVSFRPSGGR